MSASQPNARGLHRGSSNLSERSTPRGRTNFNVSTPKLACLANTLDRLRSYRFVTLSLEGGKYVGETLRGTKTRNGYGQMMYKNGNIYDGEWCHDLPHGKGLKHFANGDVYEGEWIQGMRHGYGEYRWAQEGATYHGFYERDQPNGSGTLEFRSRGQKYVGQWLNGLQHGEGIETTTRSSETGFAREGQWVLGKKNGIFTVMITCAQSVPRRAQELWDQDHLIGTDPTCSIPLLKYPPTTTLPLRKTLHKNTIPSLRSLYMSLNHFIDEVIQSTVDDMVVIEKVEAIWREEEAQKRLEKVRERIHPFHSFVGIASSSCSIEMQRE